MGILSLLIAIGLIVGLTSKYDVHPFLALFLSSLMFAAFSGMSFDLVLSSINDGFGGTLGKIGLVIVMGVIIGVFMERSGGAHQLAKTIIKLVGKNRVHEAMGLTGFLVSIPVFCDSGYIILSSLNKRLSKEAGLSIAGTGTILMLGLLITHVMVPPTPGPVAAAGILGANIGLVMLLGLIVGLLTLIVAVIYTKKFAAKIQVQSTSQEEEIELPNELPSTTKSFLPILIPILLIVGKSLLDFQFENQTKPYWMEVLGFLGSPVIALSIGVLFSLLLPKNFDKKLLSSSGPIGDALGQTANILLITGAGGIFGKMIQNSGVTDGLIDMISMLGIGIWFPFILSAGLKTAQGSSTVAILTAASIMAPLLVAMGLTSDIDIALVVLAIGAGAIVVSHANDSAFWVTTQFSGMDVKTGYKAYTLGTFVTGTSAMLIIWVFSILF